MAFIIRRGQSVRWRMTMQSGNAPADLTGGEWGIAEATISVLPAIEQGTNETWLVWTPEMTSRLKPARRRLRLKFTTAGGQVKVFPDLWIAIE